MKRLLIRGLHMFDAPVQCPNLRPVNFRSSVVEFRSLQEKSIISVERGLLIATRVTKARPPCRNAELANHLDRDDSSRPRNRSS